MKDLQPVQMLFSAQQDISHAPSLDRGRYHLQKKESRGECIAVAVCAE